jgi:GNAT superfamily N-acetyltransferase
LTNIRLYSSRDLLIAPDWLGGQLGRATWEAIQMGGSTTSERDALLAFELGLDERVCDEARTEAWGRLFLTPSLPLIWDANWVAIERPGMGLEEIVAISEEALGGAGFEHRTVAILEEAEGRRIAEEMEERGREWPGWEVERDRYMAWRGGPVDPAPAGVREAPLAEIEELRATLIRESMPPGVDELEATVEQLLEQERRYGITAGDHWFVAPAEGEPLAACALFRRDGIAQVEEVATREDARGNGYAKAIVRAAVSAAQAAGDEGIFLCADAADWPQLLYAKLGFEAVGDIAILRRAPGRTT